MVGPILKGASEEASETCATLDFPSSQVSGDVAGVAAGAAAAVAADVADAAAAAAVVAYADSACATSTAIAMPWVAVVLKKDAEGRATAGVQAQMHTECSTWKEASGQEAGHR